MSDNPIVADFNAITESNLELMSNFFKTPISTLKTGNFGYTNEIVSNVAKTGIFHRSMLYNEMFLNTASMPSSIFNFANQFNYVIPDATPSKCSVNLAIDFESVKNYANLNGGILKIKRSDTFNIGGFTFSLPYSVEIRLNGNSTLCRYLLDEVPINPNIEFIYRTNPFIKTWIQSTPSANGQRQFLFILLDLYQYETIERSWEIMNTNVSDQILFNFVYSDQLVNFNVKYNESATSNTTNDRYITKYFDSSIIPQENEYAYYDKISDNEIQVFFSVLERRFKPKFGSKISIESFVSRGQEGNFEYSGEVQFGLSVIGLEKEPIIVRLVTQPTGGKDAQSLLEVKQSLLHFQRTRDTLITDFDIQSYFDTIAKQLISSRAKVRFLKSRDDLLKRVYSAYIMMTDENKQPIPTNTVSFKVPFSTLEENDFKLKQGTLFVYDTNINSIRILRQDENPELYLFDKDAFIYTLPYYLELRFSPYTRLAYYNMFVDKSYVLYYTPVEAVTVDREFLLNEITVKRNPVTDNFYRVSCNLSVSGSAVNMVDDITVMCIVKDNSVPIGYFEIPYNTTNANFSVDLEVNDTFTPTNKLVLLGVSNFNNGLNNIEISDSIELELAVFYNFDDIGFKDGLFTAIDEPSINNKKQVIYLRTTEDVSLFIDLNDVIQSDVFINSNQTIDLVDIPLIGAGYYFNSKKLTYVMNNIEQYMLVLKDSLSRLGNNTAINLKFFNSYGISKLFSTSTVNISLDMSIKLAGAFSADLDKKIKTAIKDFIINVNDNPNRRLVISNLISFLENTFIEIDYVIFNSLNGLNLQTINYLYDISDDVNEQIVSTPEFLSINVNQSTVSNAQDTNSLNIKYI